MSEEKQWWVLAYSRPTSKPNTGHVKEFDDFEAAYEYTIEMSRQNDYLYSITADPRTLETYCQYYNYKLIP